MLRGKGPLFNLIIDVMATYFRFFCPLNYVALTVCTKLVEFQFVRGRVTQNESEREEREKERKGSGKGERGASRMSCVKRKGVKIQGYPESFPFSFLRTSSITNNTLFFLSFSSFHDTFIQFSLSPSLSFSVPSTFIMSQNIE